MHNPHLKWLDRDPCLVLLLHHLDKFGHDLVHHIINMSATLSMSIILESGKTVLSIVGHKIKHTLRTETFNNPE